MVKKVSVNLNSNSGKNKTHKEYLKNDIKKSQPQEQADCLKLSKI